MLEVSGRRPYVPELDDAVSLVVLDALPEGEWRALAGPFALTSETDARCLLGLVWDLNGLALVLGGRPRVAAVWCAVMLPGTREVEVYRSAVDWKDSISEQAMVRGEVGAGWSSQ